MIAGAEDLVRAASALTSRLPWPLGVLARVAYNYRWAWTPDGPDVFRAIDPDRWRACGRNPVRLLQETSAEVLLRAAADVALIARAEALERAMLDDLARPARTEVVSEDRPIAYFSAEYGVHVSMPIYAGGLGALAGDIVKEASDLALPFVAVGLMYRHGYFRQRIDRSGWQQEYWVPTDPERSPAVLVTSGEERLALRILVPVGDELVAAQVWRVDVGRVPMFLLDTDLPQNSRVARWITARLYDSDESTRLAQYVVLGAGGAAALRALGIDPGVVHMNEGHAAFAAVEMASAGVRAGATFDDALADVRRHTVFTTHTPVPAGNDTYPPDQVRSVVAHELGHVHNSDLPRGLLWIAIVAPAGMLLVQRLAELMGARHGLGGGVQRRPGPAALPAVALALSLVSFGMTCAGNALSRPVEARADSFALETTRDPEAFIELERSLAIRNIGDPDPPALFQTLFGTHPTTIERIGFGEALKRD